MTNLFQPFVIDSRSHKPSPAPEISTGRGRSLLFVAPPSPPPDNVIEDLEAQVKVWQAQLEANRKRLEAKEDGESSGSLMQQQIDLQRSLMEQMEQNIATLKAKVKNCYMLYNVLMLRKVKSFQS